MARIISEMFLEHICPYRCSRYKEDSHIEMETYCALPPQNFGNEPECKYQCTIELGGKDNGN